MSESPRTADDGAEAVWKRTSLGSLVKIRSGSTPSKSRPDFWGGTRPWISAKDMKTFVVRTSIDNLTDAGFETATTTAEGSILVLTRGMTLFRDVPVCVAGVPVAFNQDVKALVPVAASVDTSYLAYLLRARRNRLLSLVDTAGHGTGRLDTSALMDVLIDLPPLDRQREIAESLAAWDEAIEKTERLIDLKVRRLTGLASRLIRDVTGMAHRRLGDIARPVTRRAGNGPRRVLTSSGANGLVDQLEYFNRDVSSEDISTYHLLRRGEFAYNRSTSTGYPYGAVKRLERYDEAAISTLYLCFELVAADMSPDFLCELFDAGFMNRQLRKICQAGARSHGLLNVTKTDFFNLEIPAPAVSRQEEVATALRLARHEIDRLKQLKQLYEHQRHGLEQQLLTPPVASRAAS